MSLLSTTQCGVELAVRLRHADPEIYSAIEAELVRQRNALEMIASENFAPLAVMDEQGSVLTNRYAERHPGPRLTSSGIRIGTPPRGAREVSAGFLVEERAYFPASRRAGDADGGQKQAGDWNPVLAARGFSDAQFEVVADLVGDVPQPNTDNRPVTTLSRRVKELANAYPLHQGYDG